VRNRAVGRSKRKGYLTAKRGKGKRLKGKSGPKREKNPDKGVLSFKIAPLPVRWDEERLALAAGIEGSKRKGGGGWGTLFPFVAPKKKGLYRNLHEQKKQGRAERALRKPETCKLTPTKIQERKVVLVQESEPTARTKGGGGGGPTKKTTRGGAHASARRKTPKEGRREYAHLINTIRGIRTQKTTTNIRRGKIAQKVAETPGPLWEPLLHETTGGWEGIKCQ